MEACTRQGRVRQQGTAPIGGRRSAVRLVLLCTLTVPLWAADEQANQMSVSEVTDRIERFLEQPAQDGFLRLENLLTQQQAALEDACRGERGEFDYPSKEFVCDAVKVYAPSLLPEDYYGRGIHLSCFPELYRLKRALAGTLTATGRKRPRTTQFFKRYELCMERGFNGDLPPTYQKLLAALKLAGKRKTR